MMFRHFLAAVFVAMLAIAQSGCSGSAMQYALGLSDATILSPGRERTPDTVYLTDRQLHRAYFRGIRQKSLYTGEARSEKSGYDRFYYAHGYGRYGASDSKAIYVGEWENGEAHGQGRWEDRTTGEYFDGEWKKGEWGNFGEYRNRDGEVYKGEWRDRQKHGIGVTRYADGSRHEGFYGYGRRQGYGELFIPRENAALVKNYEGKGLWRDGWYVVRAYFRDDGVRAVINAIPWVPEERASYGAELKKLGIAVETAVETAQVPGKPGQTYQCTLVRMNGKEVAGVYRHMEADPKQARRWQQAPWIALCDGAAASSGSAYAPTLEEAVHTALRQCGKGTVADRQGEIRQAALEEERRVAGEKAAAAAREQQRKNALFTVELSSDGMDPARSGRDREGVFVFSGDMISQDITIQSAIKSAPNAPLAYPARITVRYRLRYPVTTTALAMMTMTEMKHDDIVRTYTLASRDGAVSDTVHFTLVAAARAHMGIELVNTFLSGDPELVVDVLEVGEP